LPILKARKMGITSYSEEFFFLTFGIANAGAILKSTGLVSASAKARRIHIYARFDYSLSNLTNHSSQWFTT
jgi:hypothetical protein